MNALSAIACIAERRINEAIEAGDFDNLPGSGKPLPPDETRHMAPELRMAYTILKNSGYLPPEAAANPEKFSEPALRGSLVRAASSVGVTTKK